MFFQVQFSGSQCCVEPPLSVEASESIYSCCHNRIELGLEKRDPWELNPLFVHMEENSLVPVGNMYLENLYDRFFEILESLCLRA